MTNSEFGPGKRRDDVLNTFRRQNHSCCSSRHSARHILETARPRSTAYWATKEALVDAPESKRVGIFGPANSRLRDRHGPAVQCSWLLLAKIHEVVRQLVAHLFIG